MEPETSWLLDITTEAGDVTSPSQLQEVTFDQDATFPYMGMRSPGALTCGRSVKEFEDQLSNLKKENFNLKLRIYFLEERMGPNFNSEQENAIKKNIELMVEVESLRKEVADKQDLLCQAVKAMELEEEERKKDVQSRDSIINNLRENILILKEQLINFDAQKALCFVDSRQRQSEAQIKELEEALDHASSKMMRIKEELDKKSYELKKTIEHLEKQQQRNEHQQTQVEELKMLLSDVQNRCDMEQQKADKYKATIIEKNSRNVELETVIDKQKVKIRYLERKIVTPAIPNEVMRKIRAATSVTELPTSPIRPQLTGTNISSSSSSSLHLQNIMDSGDTNVDESVSTMLARKELELDEKDKCISKLNEALNVANKELYSLKKVNVKSCRIISKVLTDRKQHQHQVATLKSAVEEKEIGIAKLEEHITELKRNMTTCTVLEKKSLHDRVSELNLTATVNPADNIKKSMEESNGEDSELTQQYKNFIVELEKKIQVLRDMLKEKDSYLERLKAEYSEVIQKKDNRIIELEYEVITSVEGLNVSSRCDLFSEKTDESSEKNCSCQETVESKEKIIEVLRDSLQKRTCDLQGIVNKELWEKNREIEKLQLRYTDMVQARDREIITLTRDVSRKDTQLKLLKNKINELCSQINLPVDFTAAPSELDLNDSDEIKCLQDKLALCLKQRVYFTQEISALNIQLENLSVPVDVTKELHSLKVDYDSLNDKFEKLEKSRQENHELCNVLSTRLEELCYFLDSLLKQKSILGFLGSKRSYKLRQVIDQSLNLSRTLSTSMLPKTDQSLLQLSNLSDLLNSTGDENLSLNEFFSPDENNSVLSIIPSEITLTYQSHLTPLNTDEHGMDLCMKQAQVIKVLREQVEDLKHEIVVRDLELEKKLSDGTLKRTERVLENDQDLVDAIIDWQTKSPAIKQPKSPDGILQELLETTTSAPVPSFTADKSGINTTSTTLKNKTTEQSESESWSEPDRTVSMARIGLVDESLKPPSSAGSNRRNRFTTVVAASADSTEEDQTCSLSKTPSKRSIIAENRQTIITLHEQVCELETKLQEKENRLMATQLSCLENQNLLKTEKAKTEQSIKYQQELETKIKTVEEQLNNAEEKKKKAEQRVVELENIVTTLEEFKVNVEHRMVLKDKDMQNRINQLEVEKEQTLAAAVIAQKVAEDAKIDIQAAETKLRNMKSELELIEHTITEQLELEYSNKVKDIEHQYIVNVKTVEETANNECRKLKDAMVQMRTQYEQDYIKKSEVEKSTHEVERIVKEVDNLKDIVKLAENKMREMEQRETNSKNEIRKLEQMHHNKLQIVRQELDSIALQHSETMLEKSKLSNEKILLEQELKQHYVKETELLRQVNEIQQEFASVKQNYQKQNAQLVNSKSKLERKVSELESVNAELRNRLVKIQADHPGHIYSASLPNSPNKIIDSYTSRTYPIPIRHVSSYMRQFSDHSGYNSEEVIAEECGITRKLFTVHRSFIGDEDKERHQANSSPDLGIESDQGRFSSLEANVNIPRPLLPALELTQSMSNLLEIDHFLVQDITCSNELCCKKIRQLINENIDLRRRLLRTKRALEETVTQLKMANKQKKEVEKTICKQIHKTSQVLRKAKANLDSGSESDILLKK